jgi:fermentation-respiration switch protein FrsA (DUF1100 family)
MRPVAVKMLWFAGIAIGCYLAVCLLAFSLQRRLTYFPIPWTPSEADRANPGYEEVSVRTADGEELHAWLNRVEDSPWTVIIFHGNAGNLMYHEAPLGLFRALGLQAILFDYRGYGLSSGSPSEAGLLRDGEAVRDYALTTLGVPGERLVYFGQSLGSGAAALLAAARPPGRLILESAYPALPDVARRHYPFLPVGLLMRDRFAAVEKIAAVKCPILFLHPELDEIIPIDLGRALFEKASEPKRFVQLSGAHHNDTFETAFDQQVEAITGFLSDSP